MIEKLKTKMAADWGEDDFYGAECEMDDQMLLAADEEETDDSEEVLSGGDQEYERKFSEKEAEVCESEQHFEQKLRVSRSRRNNPDIIYPPERKPPIFDFFTVLTAFIAAVILAYYTISSY